MNEELRRRADEIIERYRVSDAVGRRTKLRRAGGEYRGLCPFHDERSPSFFVNDAKAFYHCFGCGAHGDVIRFVMLTEHVGFIAALDMIDGGTLPIVRPEEMAKARADDEALDREKCLSAAIFWSRAGPVEGTAADLYLSGRGIITRPDALRFGEIPAWRDDATGEWGPRYPALLLKAETLDGEFAGIQRIFLTPDGQKRPMRNPKRSLGNLRGMSIRFGHVRSEAIVCGSPEDGLTLYQRHAEYITVYVTCGEAMMPMLRLPRHTRTVTVARQNDKPGMIAANKARAAFREQGRNARIISPPPSFKDWNDELRGLRMEEAA